MLKWGYVVVLEFKEYGWEVIVIVFIVEVFFFFFYKIQTKEKEIWEGKTKT